MLLPLQVTGLAGCTFIDRTREPPNSYQECRDVVTIGEWTDRIYTLTPPEHIITNVVSGRKMRIQKYNFPDTVIWNPWIDKAKASGTQLNITTAHNDFSVCR